VPEDARRKRTLVDDLVDLVEPIIREAGFTRAEWNSARELVKSGYRIMLFGNGIEVGYVDTPHVLEQHEAEIDRLIAILSQRLGSTISTFGGSKWRLSIERGGNRLYGWSHINIYMNWISYV